MLLRMKDMDHFIFLVMFILVAACQTLCSVSGKYISTKHVNKKHGIIKNRIVIKTSIRQNLRPLQLKQNFVKLSADLC